VSIEGGLSGRGINGRGRMKVRVLGGDEDRSASHTYTYYNETHHTLFEKGERGRGLREYNRGVNMFKVHCAYGIIIINF
jgi:hypothetical protein